MSGRCMACVGRGTGALPPPAGRVVSIGPQASTRGDQGGAAARTVYWSWATTIASRIGVMNDLFVAPSARGSGAAEQLIRACVDECRRHGATELTWQTAPDNERAQRLYDRVGATRSQWVDYSLSVRE